jgi:hypothetical protein
MIKITARDAPGGPDHLGDDPAEAIEIGAFVHGSPVFLLGSGIVRNTRRVPSNSSRACLHETVRQQLKLVADDN